MLLLALLACAHLEEGRYAIDYAPVSTDSCNLYEDGQALDDAEGTLSWAAEDRIAFVFDGTDDVLEYAVDGATLSRSAEDTVPLDDSGGCWFSVSGTDAGEVLSDTSFEGQTELLAVVQGDACTVQRALFPDPCTVVFDWTGTFVD